MLYGVPDRETAWRCLPEGWDLIVIGGGITGAGILREGARVGLRILLVEQNDFASGTSSRSSKLVHGGLRYLNNRQGRMTWHAVRERDTLLREGAGLVEPLPFLYATYQHDRFPPWMMKIGLRLYSWMAGKWRAYQSLDLLDLQMMSPGLSDEHLTGGFRYCDAQTDDARLVVRVIREGVASDSAVALNYARVESLMRNAEGTVSGVVVRDIETRRTCQAHASAVVNATGVWADQLRNVVGAPSRIRPLRGSHLIFAHDRFPVFQAITFSHPEDGRPVFVFPWEGVTMLGTTDLDHHQPLDQEPASTLEEVHYLLRAVQTHFPSLSLSESDVMATFAGVRAVVGDEHRSAPSEASREHVLWEEEGLLTVTGGKLTTFRRIALDALKVLRKRLPRMAPVDDHFTALDPPPAFDDPPPDLTRKQALRLVARYGAGILDFVRERPPAELRRIGGLPTHWFELPWAARCEAVLHLDDLLLRRVRLGLLLPRGGEAYLPRVCSLVQGELGWSNDRWAQEARDYLAGWRTHYGPPETDQEG